MIRFALRIPDDLHARLTVQATADRRSINSEILHLIEGGLSDATVDGASPSGESLAVAPPQGKPDSSPA